MDTSKIIKGAVSNGRYTVTAPIVKEDYGLYLQIEGIELPSTYEVDFSNNENSGTSVTMIGNSEGVLIPREFIETGKDIFAFLYVVGINYGRTVYKFRIPNKLRPDRTNIAPTPEEQSVIDQAISALNSAVAQTAQDVIDADASAQSAQGYAEQAEDARDNAQTYSNNAQTSANNASASAQASANSATASAQSASASAQIKSDIEGMVDDAQGYAQASAQSATASANSATTAQGYANTASASAQSASTSASDALTYANTASSKASEASTSAQTASTKASEASASASTATAKATEATTAATSANTAKTDAVAAKTAAETAQGEAEDAAQSVSASAAQIATNTADITDLKEGLSEDATTEYNQSYTVIENSQVKSTTGVISESDMYSRSDYTELKECESVTFEGTSVGYINCCFYDENKVFIQGYAFNNGATYNRPSSAKYVIFTTSKSTIKKAVLTLNNVPTVVSKIYDALDTKASIITDGNINYINKKTLLQNVIGVSKFPNNLVNAEDWVNNKFVNALEGSLIAGNNYFATGYIPVTAGQTYKSNLGRNYAWYDSSKTYISGATGTSIQYGITAPTNAAYIRFTVNKITDGISSPIYLYFADTQYYDNAVTIQGLVATEVKPWCYGQKINWIGDSIVDGADFDEVVCSALGLVKNSEYGINGSTIALKADGTDGRNALCERYGDMSNDADIIAVSCGTNDFEYAWCPIGTINDADDGTSNTTFYGALKALCKGLIDKYPQKLIFFTTPIKRGQAFESGNGGEYTADGAPTTPFSKNKYGKTLMDYANIIKEVCGYYSIPVLDMYRESLLNPHIASQQGMFDNVLTHPNVTGQKIMARRVAGWLTQLGYNIP